MTDEKINELFDEFLEKKQEEKEEKAVAAMLAAFDAKLKPKTAEPKEEPPKPAYQFDPNENRALIRAVLEDFVRCEKISVSQIQQRFYKGYNAAAAIMEFLEKQKFIVTDKHGGKSVALTPDEIYRICPDGSDG